MTFDALIEPWMIFEWCMSDTRRHSLATSDILPECRAADPRQYASMDVPGTYLAMTNTIDPFTERASRIVMEDATAEVWRRAARSRTCAMNRGASSGWSNSLTVMNRG